MDPSRGETIIDVVCPIDDGWNDNNVGLLEDTIKEDHEKLADESWTDLLDRSGLQIELPRARQRIWDLYRICRGNLLQLAVGEEFHPGPTIYDGFWIRDSAVQAIAAAAAGDVGISRAQIGSRYTSGFFDIGSGVVSSGGADLNGFFGGPYEAGHKEWDANGEALWAIGRFDRLTQGQDDVAARMYDPLHYASRELVRRESRSLWTPAIRMECGAPWRFRAALLGRLMGNIGP
jgi:hypothetical protein